MAVRDGADYLGEAIASILDQSWRDLELRIVDDGSRDVTPGIIARAAARDARVVWRREAPRDFAHWLAVGVAEARGDLIARMDADDVAHPERIARQVAYLDAHPECVALGTEALMIDPHGRPIRTCGAPQGHAAIEAELCRGNGFALVHPTAMLRRAAVLAAGNYSTEFAWVEDVDLFLRLAEHGQLANLSETLLRYRQHERSVNARRGAEQRRNLERVLALSRARRGLAPLAALDRAERETVPQLWEAWARGAIGGGHRATARHYAWAVWRAAPAAGRSWRLLARALLGVRLGWLRGARTA
jgi:glycosyltransferase involved in cell wall biosynthesis